MTASPAAVHEASTAEVQELQSLVVGAGLPLAGLEAAWRTWVASSSGDVVGGVALERYDTEGRPVFLLRSLVVDDARRGEGVGASLVSTALHAADMDVGAPARVALLTETADGYFPRFGFASVDRGGLPPAVAGSAELTGACPDSARAFLRG
jgi:amino-acid N-acetyltransferase